MSTADGQCFPKISLIALYNQIFCATGDSIIGPLGPGSRNGTPPRSTLPAPSRRTRFGFRKFRKLFGRFHRLFVVVEPTDRRRRRWTERGLRPRRRQRRSARGRWSTCRGCWPAAASSRIPACSRFTCRSRSCLAPVSSCDLYSSGSSAVSSVRQISFNSSLRPEIY